MKVDLGKGKEVRGGVGDLLVFKDGDVRLITHCDQEGRWKYQLLNLSGKVATRYDEASAFYIGNEINVGNMVHKEIIEIIPNHQLLLQAT